MKNVIVSGLICIFPLISTLAQTNELEQTYKDFKKAAIAEYTSFRKQANEEYTKWMRLAWENHKALPALPKPKDKDLPPVIFDNGENSSPTFNNQIPIEIVPLPEISPQPLPLEPIKEVPDVLPEFAEFSFYGLACKIRFANTQRKNIFSLSNDDVADIWDFMANNRLFDNTVRDCLEFRARHNLCDWAYIQFVDNLAFACYKSENDRNLLMAFLLCQSGYKIRLAKSNDKLYFLYASPHFLYDLATFQIDHTIYYGYNCTETELEIFNTSFPNEQSVSFWIPLEPKFGLELSKERIIRSKNFSDITISVKVNKNLIDFFNTYPTSVVDNDFMTRWAMYANTPMSSNLVDTIYPQLRKLLNKCDQLEALNKLLNFVQTGFVYEYDDKVWGYDRAFFSEETLFYPYCDCEDRSILFSRLVRDLLGLDVILVFYPGHLATAVAATEIVSGDYISFDNKKFIISDPTYIGAPVGMTMPEMDNKTAKIILLSR